MNEERRGVGLTWLHLERPKDDQVLRMICELLLQLPELNQPLKDWANVIFLRFLELVPKKRFSGKQQAEMVDRCLETGKARTKTEARRYVAEALGEAEEVVEKNHRRAAQQKEKRRLGTKRGKLDGDKNGKVGRVKKS